MGPIASVISSALWSIASVWFARLSARFDPMAVNAAKNGIALVLFGATLLATQATLVPAGLELTQVGWLALSAFIGLALGDTAFFATLRLLGTRRAVTLTLLGPPMAALLGVVVLAEPLTSRLVGGMALTLLGLWLVVGDQRGPAAQTVSARQLAIGVAIALFAALCQATGATITRHASHGLDALEVSVVRLFFAVILLVGMLLATRRHRALVELLNDRPDRHTLWLATGIGTYGGIWFMNEGLLHAPIGVAATLNSLAPVFMLPVARFWLRERITPRAAVGALVATAGAATLML